MKKNGRLTEEQLERAKCVDSPTGAHHWMIAMAEGPISLGTCKYCGETREFYNVHEYNPQSTDGETTPRSPLAPFGQMRDHRW